MKKNELIDYRFGNIHSHTDYSNVRLLDASETVKDVLDEAKRLNYSLIGFTEHEALGSHLKAINTLNNGDYGDLKIILGNEIYLVDKDEMDNAVDNNLSAKDFRFNHFLLNALDYKGHQFLQKQSTQAWKNSFRYHGMFRVPSFYHEIEEMMKGYKGHVIASSACLGGYVDQELIAYRDTEDTKHLNNVINFCKWGVKVFGEENFFLELMPGDNLDQMYVNQRMRDLCAKMGYKFIITLDSHYVNESARPVHTALLQSRDIDRDVSVYDSAHFYSTEDLFQWFDDDTMTEGLQNIKSIEERVEQYELAHTPIVPTGRIPKFDKLKYEDLGVEETYSNVQFMIDSEDLSDNYLVKMAVDGLKKYKFDDKKEYWERLDLELGELVKIGNKIGQAMSAYFVLMTDILDLVQDKSLLGAGRGSSSCWLLNFLIGLTKINALEYGLPYYRFLSAERVSHNTAGDYPDIDSDSEANQRGNILQHIKDVYGEERVLSFGTFSTVGTKSAIQMAGRSLGLEAAENNYIASLLPGEGHTIYDLPDAINGNPKKGIKPGKKLLEELDKHGNMKDIAMGLYKIVVGVSQHASGLMIAEDSYTEHNAMMKTKNGIPITQFDAPDTEEMGHIKLDVLALNALDKIHEAMNLLLNDGKLEWQGTLKSTFEKYFDVDKLDFTNQEMYDKLANNEIVNAFEFTSKAGRDALHKADAHEFLQVTDVNGLMRLTGGDAGELAIDRFVRYSKNINSWDEDMDKAGLNSQEKQTMHDKFDISTGINSSQEGLMDLVITVVGYSLEEANKIRKSVAKKDKKAQQEAGVFFYKKAEEEGLRDEFARYIWEQQIMIQANYAFAKSHALVYTLNLLIEMNIAQFYGLEYWSAAVLSVNSGLTGDVVGTPDYEKVATAIGELPKGTVIAPNVNKSGIGFTPDLNKKNILFGLGGIVGLGDKEIKSIAEHRPFKSVDDFLERESEDLNYRKMIIAIKSGMLNEFEPDRRKLLIKLVSDNFPAKAKLTTTSVNKLKDVIPDNLMVYVMAYHINTRIKKNPFSSQSDTGQYFLNIIEPLILERQDKSKKGVEGGLWDMNEDTIVIDQKQYKKWMDKYIVPLKDWLKTNEATNLEANMNRREEWIKNMSGNPEHWSFETLHYYPEKHELELSTLNEIFTYKGFKELSESPKVIGFKKWRGREFPQYNSTVIAGTVISKDNVKSSVTILTADGVANVSLGKDRFAKYNKKIIEGTGKSRHCVENSWLDVGTRLVLTGYRDQNDFRLRKYQGMERQILKVDGFGTKISVNYNKM